MGSVFCLQPYILPLAEIGLTGSIYFTIAISIERYLVICKPFLHLSRSISSRFYIITSVLYSIILKRTHLLLWLMRLKSIQMGLCKQFFHGTPSRFYIIPTLCFSIIFNIPHFFEWKIEQNNRETDINIGKYNASSARYVHTYNDEEIIYHVQYTEFRRNETYYKIYSIHQQL